MVALHLAYEDGFEDDTVVVQVDGKEVARQVGLKSSLATALAATEQVRIPATKGTVQVSVPTRKLSASLQVDFSAQPHLAIAIRDGTLLLRPSQEPPHYL